MHSALTSKISVPFSLLVVVAVADIYSDASAGEWEGVQVVELNSKSPINVRPSSGVPARLCFRGRRWWEPGALFEELLVNVTTSAPVPKLVHLAVTAPNTLSLRGIFALVTQTQPVTYPHTDVELSSIGTPCLEIVCPQCPDLTAFVGASTRVSVTQRSFLAMAAAVVLAQIAPALAVLPAFQYTVGTLSVLFLLVFIALYMSYQRTNPLVFSSLLAVLALVSFVVTPRQMSVPELLHELFHKHAVVVVLCAAVVLIASSVLAHVVISRIGDDVVATGLTLLLRAGAVLYVLSRTPAVSTAAILAVAWAAFAAAVSTSTSLYFPSLRRGGGGGAGAGAGPEQAAVMVAEVHTRVEADVTAAAMRRLAASREFGAWLGRHGTAAAEARVVHCSGGGLAGIGGAGVRHR